MYVVRLAECLACEPSDESVKMLNQVFVNFLYKIDIADDCKQQVGTYTRLQNCIQIYIGVNYG